MNLLWLLKGQPEAEGWLPLQIDAQAQKVKVLHFDRDKWALVKSSEPPTHYEGMTPEVPADGLYLDNFGRPLYVVGQKEVHSAKVVVQALGKEAQDLLAKLGDADLALEKLGRVF